MRENLTDLMQTPAPRTRLLTPEQSEAIQRAVTRYRERGDAMFNASSWGLPFDELLPSERQQRILVMRREFAAGASLSRAAEDAGVPYRVAVREIRKERRG